MADPQEKFLFSHFGFKKGNNWDFQGIFLGKPKVGKVLPLPFMGQENPILIPTMGIFWPNFYPRMGVISFTSINSSKTKIPNTLYSSVYNCLRRRNSMHVVKSEKRLRLQNKQIHKLT